MGTPAILSNSYMILGRQTAFGTVSVGTAAWGKKISLVKESIKGAGKLIDSALLGGDPNPRRAVQGRKEAGGDLVTYPNIKSAPYLAEWGLGSRASVGSSDPVTHTMKLAGSLPYMTAEVYFDLATDEFKQAIGVTVESLRMTVSDEGFLEWTFSTKARSTALATSSIFTTPTSWTDDSCFDHGQLAAAFVKLAGSANGKLLNHDITISNNLKGEYYPIGSQGVRGACVRGRATVKGTLLVGFEDLVEYNLALNKTYTSLDLTWSQGTNRTLQTLLPEILLEPTDATVESDGFGTILFNLTGSKEATAATAYEIVVVNDQLTAAYD